MHQAFGMYFTAGLHRDDVILRIDDIEQFVADGHGRLPFKQGNAQSSSIDRKIEFPMPNEKTKRRIFQIHTSKMTLADDVDLEEYIMSKDDLSGADIKAICSEAGLLALRERRMKVTNADFRKSKENVLYRKQEGLKDGMYL